MLFSASYNNQKAPTGNCRRLVHQNPNSGRDTLLVSQSSRAAWRGLCYLYPSPHKQNTVKILLQDREARSLTSSSSIIYYLSSASITTTCSSRDETRNIQALLNLIFFMWLGEAEVWLCLIFSFSNIFLWSKVFQVIRRDFPFFFLFLSRFSSKMWN